MNAYELADELDGWSDHWLSDKQQENVFKEHANMLRQQADELEAFKLNFYNTGYALQLRDKDETIRQQADRIAELEKDLHLYKNKYQYNELVKFVQDATAKELKKASEK